MDAEKLRMERRSDLHSTRKRSLGRQAGVFILCPQRERRFDKDPGADELPKAGARNETLFFQLYYTWYGSVCEASRRCVRSLGR